MYAAFLNLGYQEIFLILIVAVLLFGGRLPEVSRNVGRWFFDLKKGMNDLNRDIYAPTPPDPPRPAAGPDSRSVPHREDRLLLDAEVTPDDPYVHEDVVASDVPDTGGVSDDSDGDAEEDAGSTESTETVNEEAEKKEAGQKEAGSGN